VNKTTTTHLVPFQKLNPFYDTRGVGNMLWRLWVLGGSVSVHEVHEYQHGEEPYSNVYAWCYIC